MAAPEPSSIIEYLTNSTDLTKVADAIRAKGGTTEQLIYPDGFVTAIEDIPTGGTPSEPPAEADINFYDYDGTLLYAWTLAELAGKTALPDLPTRTGLICQGWNWTLENIKAQGTPINVGANYITDDGATRFYLDIPEGGVLTMPLMIAQSVSGGVTISWGDGQTETISGTGNVQTSHTYATPGKYTLSLLPAEGCEINFGHSVAEQNVFGSISNNNLALQANVKKVELGRGFSGLRAFSLQNMRAVTCISMPAGITSMNSACVAQCEALKAIALPKNLTTLGGSVLTSCTSLAVVAASDSTYPANNFLRGAYAAHKLIFRKALKSIGNLAFQNCYALSAVYGIGNVTSMGNNAFQNCRNLCNDLPALKITSVPASCFSGCYSLSRLRFTGAITNIAAGAFTNCYGIMLYDFTGCTAVPTLANTNAFTGINANCKIQVPASLVDEWKAATNWATYADYIVGIAQGGGSAN
jgi:hypothetical protein